MRATDASTVSLATTRIAGYALALAGLGLLIGSFSFPTAFDADTYRELTAAVMNDSGWRFSNWFFFGSMALMAFALWSLLDAERVRGDARATALLRAAIVSALLLAVGMGHFVAAYTERGLYRDGVHAPLIAFAERNDTLCWPIFGLSMGAFALLASRGWSLTPRWAGVLAAIGGVAVALAAIVGIGFHVLGFAYLTGLGALLWIWFIWAGWRLARG